jgi:hypothetical protein
MNDLIRALETMGFPVAIEKENSITQSKRSPTDAPTQLGEIGTANHSDCLFELWQVT